ncbi:XRE family transcriptional regulator [Rathayibacter sp. AY1C9]|uniref:helix-turn-helix transcriptional regulator n=1 Tax=Rathayibacter sp. AY1C9 TaxID=2080541 RepID=UPI000CE89BC2|nr:helix-turn-helix transcriptional regulator [Rathayibacter sp. AY1C9]PPH42800.1 XRE family transcriptional regulator [Rathayibacter sp. AY1C9]
MSSRSPLAEFLRARRAALRPEQVGVPTAGTRRRVPGLRREEVADRAQISRDYYLRVEQGHAVAPSDQVLNALAEALAFDEFERAYLFRLARLRPGPRDPDSPPQGQGVESLLAHWPRTPAYAFDRNLDVLGANDLMSRLAPDKGVPGANMLLSTSRGYARAVANGDPPDQLQAWGQVFRELIAALRFYSDPDDPRLHEIVGECSVENPLFRSIWAEYQVRPFTHRWIRVHVEPFGWLDLEMQTLELAGAPGRYVVTYLAAAGTPAAEAVDVLASLRPAPEAGTALAAPAGA